MKKAQIQLYRSDKTNEFNSFETLERTVLSNDNGSQYILDHNLKDGETLIFRYKNENRFTGKILPYSCYGVVYNDGFEGVDNQGIHRKISLYKSYDDFYRIYKQYDANPNISNGIKINNDFSIFEQNIHEDILSTSFLCIKQGENITFTTKDDNSVYINGVKNTDTKYTATSGLKMVSNALTLEKASSSTKGGVFSDRNITNYENFEKCPIVNNILYYKPRKGRGCGNDYVDHKLKVTDSGWYKIAISDPTKNNTGIFTIASGLREDETIITFIASYNITSYKKIDPNDNENNFDGVNLTQIACSSNKPNFNNNNINIRAVISSARILYPKNYDQNSSAFLEIYIHTETNSETYVNIDVSNLRGWIISRGNSNHILTKENYPDDNAPSGYTQESLFFNNYNALRAKSFYQGNNRVIDENDFATTNSPGIIKLKNDTRISNLTGYYPVELDSNKNAYVKVPNVDPYVLPVCQIGILGGFKCYDYGTVLPNLSPLVESNEFGFFKTPKLNSNGKKYGLCKISGSKTNNIDISNITPNGNTILPVSLNKNNELCVFFEKKVPSVATINNLGLIKLYKDERASSITTNFSNPKYLPLQLNSNHVAAVKSPKIPSNPYTLPVATTTELGGIKAFQGIHDLSNNKLQMGGTYCPVFTDVNKIAVIKYSSNTSISTPFTATIYDESEIEEIFANNIQQNNLGALSYRNFLFHHSIDSLNLSYYINSLVRHLPNEPYSVDIYVYQSILNMYGSMQYNVVLNQNESNGAGADLSLEYDVKFSNLNAYDSTTPVGHMNRSRQWYGTYLIENNKGIHINITNVNQEVNGGNQTIRFSNPTFAVMVDKLYL